jgi:hypothetical protein
MLVSLDLRPLYLAEVKRIAKKTDMTVGSVVSGMVKLYLDDIINEGTTTKGSSSRPGGAIEDQYGNNYPSVKVAAEKLGLQARLIYYVLSGKRNHTGGYRFEYV